MKISMKKKKKFLLLIENIWYFQFFPNSRFVISLEQEIVFIYKLENENLRAKIITRIV